MRKTHRTRRNFLRGPIAATLGVTAASQLQSGATADGATTIPPIGSGADMDYTLREIYDRIEIHDLFVRYCYALDDHDWDTLRTVFTPDAIIDNTENGGPRTGVDETIEFIRAALERTIISQHGISTTLIDIEEDHASSRTLASCPIVVANPDGGTAVFLQGLWYNDRLIRTREGWRIKERVERGYWKHDVPPWFDW